MAGGGLEQRPEPAQGGRRQAILDPTAGWQDH